MNTLHIVNQASALETCRLIADRSDTVLLIADGVLAVSDDQDRTILALQEDVTSRGLTRIGTNVGLIDVNGFVQLVATHQPIVTWR